MGRSDGLHAYVPCFRTLVEDMWRFFLEEVKSHPTYGRLPVFVLGESMGGNVAIQLGLKDADEGRGLLNGAILLAPMVTIKDEMKPPQVGVWGGGLCLLRNKTYQRTHTYTQQQTKIRC